MNSLILQKRWKWPVSPSSERRLEGLSHISWDSVPCRTGCCFVRFREKPRAAGRRMSVDPSPPASPCRQTALPGWRSAGKTGRSMKAWGGFIRLSLTSSHGLVTADLSSSDWSNNSQELLWLRLEGNVLQTRRVQALAEKSYTWKLYKLCVNASILTLENLPYPRSRSSSQAQQSFPASSPPAGVGCFFSQLLPGPRNSRKKGKPTCTNLMFRHSSKLLKLQSFKLDESILLHHGKFTLLNHYRKNPTRKIKTPLAG